MRSSGKLDVPALLAGNRRALARALTEVENDSQASRAALDALFPYSGKAHMVGVTGSPGTGKSSLVNQMTRLLRNPGAGEPHKVAIVAVDPSSPFTGGAILGDRIRMRDIADDPGVFIRSMASRGHLGGIARTTSAMVRVLDAAGFDLILIETVGAGQSEVDIARLAHSTIVVEAPGMGDDIQAIKAGILEIADILVVNKADHPLADNTVRALSASLAFARPDKMAAMERYHHKELAFQPVKPDQAPSEQKNERWIPPVLKTVSTEGIGIENVVAAIYAHAEFLRSHQQWHLREAARLQEELNELLMAAFAAEWRKQVDQNMIEAVVGEMLARKLSPQNAADQLLRGKAES